MSSLAKLLLTFSLPVSGSDLVKNEQTDELIAFGAKVFVGVDGRRRELLEADVVVYTDAISTENEELLSALKQGKKVYKRVDFLAKIAREYDCLIAIAGSHGKTTCTSMCAHILKTAAAPFTAHIGGEDLSLSNFYFSGRNYLLTEACEYKKNVLKIPADIAVLLNVDKDHLECYEGEEDLKESFFTYQKRARVAIANADDSATKKGENFITFGIENEADYRAKDLTSICEKYSFTVEERGRYLCRVRLDVVGKHNVYNALAAVAAARQLHISPRAIQLGLYAFKGVKRRFEFLGDYLGVNILCDYAHHPNEIRSTLLTAAKIKRGSLFVVFQPHTYSRTRLLFEEFCECFSGVENLMVYKTYAAREAFDEAGSAFTLSKALQNCLYAESLREVKVWIEKSAKKGDTVLFLGAGDIYCIAKFLATQGNF